MLGPFFVSNTATTFSINYQNVSGILMTIMGVVYDENDQPLANTKIDIWHADGVGRYYPENDGTA